MKKSDIIITDDSISELTQIVENRNSDSIFILTDSNTQVHCLPRLLKIDKLKSAKIITIEPDDRNKNIDAAIQIWTFLVESFANRQSLMINLGGGVITDIGGFVASTFKRGIPYVNVTTTLLGAVDAATGGKTGINFMGYKNEIGVFAPSLCTIIDVEFLKTLDKENLLSGYAEMIKHTLISDEDDLNELLDFDLEEVDFDTLKYLLTKNLNTKEDIVVQDPYEVGIRKALNFGHTVGHAIESYMLSIGQPVLHGYAIAWGMVSELYLSVQNNHFPEVKYQKIKQYVFEKYGTIGLKSDCFDDIVELMKHDKKNIRKGEINFTLLKDIGDIDINQSVSKEDILKSLKILS